MPSFNDTLSRERREVVTSPKDMPAEEFNVEDCIFLPWRNINVNWEIRLYHDALVYQKSVHPYYMTMSGISFRYYKHLTRMLNCGLYNKKSKNR